ncbi:MAG TPA: cation:proton antiporter [Candidatus Binatia bacterium]|nr:cation:proton antiporter [Candidatus Binatia bacterium]
MSRPAPHSPLLRTALVYGLMIAAAVGAFLAIRARGAGLVASLPAAQAGASAGAAARDAGGLPHLLLALLVVILAARAVGWAFRRIGQPPVVGEVVAGILLGPSLLGRVAPEAWRFVLPAAVAPDLQVVAQVGVILYMFVVGVELDPAHLRRSPHAALAISHASILLPFVLGSALALVLYPLLATRDVPFTAFALFLGVSMSVTAFPVLARILTDRGMQTTPLGVLALTCAAVDDVTAWCLLAFLVSVVKGGGASPVATVLLTAAFIAAMVVAVRPVLVRVARRVEASPARTSSDAVALVLMLLLASALATEAIGIHALFGAFLLGVVIPHESRLARDLADRIEDVVVVLLLPAFFAFSGMRTRIELVSGAQDWLVCGLIVLVACAGKFGGSALAARLAGLSWRSSSALGVLMNTRGLVELIVLNVGLDLGVISPTLFAMLIVMALVTTLATSPLLVLLVAPQSMVASVGSPSKARPASS